MSGNPAGTGTATGGESAFGTRPPVQGSNAAGNQSEYAANAPRPALASAQIPAGLATGGPNKGKGTPSMIPRSLRLSSVLTPGTEFATPGGTSRLGSILHSAVDTRAGAARVDNAQAHGALNMDVEVDARARATRAHRMRFWKLTRAQRTRARATREQRTRAHRL